MNKKNPLRRYKLTVEYDGTNFSGWQKQTDARTVQGDLWKGIVRVLAERALDLQGCGRTDAGVHALAYVAHLEVAGAWPITDLADQLNASLPKDIAIVAVEAVDPRFHARHSCLARSYIYQLRTRKSAFGKRYDWWVHEDLDLAAMERAAALMVGMHDYAAFAEKQEMKKSTLALIHQVRIITTGDLTKIRVVGSHFLWHMVRRMVGVLVEVGCHRLGEEDVRRLFSGPSTLPSRHTAPASGLFFEKAYYDETELAEFDQA